MAETQRSLADLLALLADNTSQDISPQDLRDMLISIMGVYGELWTAGRSTGTTIGTSFIKLDNWENNGAAKKVTVDSANNKMSIQIAGLYRVSATFSVNTDTDDTFRVSLFKEGAEQQNVTWQRALSSALNITDADARGFVTCAVDDELDFRAKGKNTGGDLTFVDANFTVRLMG